MTLFRNNIFTNQSNQTQCMMEAHNTAIVLEMERSTAMVGVKTHWRACLQDFGGNRRCRRAESFLMSLDEILTVTKCFRTFQICP